MACVGNVGIILSIIQKKALQHSANILLANMAFADFLSTLCLLPSLGVRFISSEFLKERETFCEIWLLLLMASMCSSLTSMQCISINRYMFITKPRHAYDRFFSGRKTVIIVVIIWIWSTVIIYLTLFVCGNLEYSETLNGCYYQEGHPRSWVCLAMVIIISIFLCIFIMPTFSCLTLKAIHRSRKQVQQHSSTASSSTPRQIFSKEELAITKMILIVLAMFLICWLPYSIAHFTSYKHFPSRLLSYIVIVFALINNAVNPLIYAWMNKPIRKSLVEMVSSIHLRSPAIQ